MEKKATDNVGNRLFPVDVALHDTILVDANRGEDIQSVLVTRIDTVEDQTDDNLLPCGPTLVPELGFLQVDNVTDVLHDTVQGSSGQHLVFIVVGNGNEQLCVTVVHGRSKVVSIVQGEFVGIAGGRGIFKYRVSNRDKYRHV